MSLIIGLFIVGIIFLALEVFVPGGVIGVLGGISIIAGIVMSYRDYGSEGLVLSILAALGLVVIMLFVEIKILPKTSLGRRFFLRRSIEGTSQPEVVDKEYLGQICQTVTALAPSGYVLFEGKRVEAASKSGFIEKDESVKVVGKETFRLIVSKV